MSEASQIVRAIISPGIGIARVGNSEDGYFLAPDVPYPVPPPEGGYRDPSGAIKRQVALFRIYGLDSDGQVVAELTEDNATIEWEVHVANKKAWWYDFVIAMDIPEALPARLRNDNFHGEDRNKLIIDPGPASVSGCGAESGPLIGTFLTGTDLETPVELGELRTDDQGRLLFFGGRGVSGSPAGSTANTFGNNDTWYDDISDGPVHARVAVDGCEIPCEGAWVVVAPPNYGPDILSLPTMYDVLVNAYIGNWMEQPEKPSFTRDIFPIFERFAMSQWVNKGFAAQYGWQGPYDFLDADFIARLAQPGAASKELRRQIFNQFRFPQQINSSIDLTAPDNSNLGNVEVAINSWPWMYGDAMTTNDPTNNSYLPVTELMYQFLYQWSEGDFEADWEGFPNRPTHLDEVPMADQPAVLDEAAMTYCLGGPFHPGCEMTWPVRNSSMYTAPFRFRERPAADPEPDYGPVLRPRQVYTQGTNLAGGGPVPGGPLYFNGPGDISRWMAVPWQTDTSSCRSGYAPQYDPYLPTFWPARVPNQVLSERDYAIVMDPSRPRQERLDAFANRAVWYRWLGPDWDYIGQINRMVKIFGDLGIVERRPGPPDDPDFPKEMWVEILPDDILEKFGEVPDDQGKLVLNFDRFLRRPAKED